jgi:hypothetical protein
VTDDLKSKDVKTGEDGSFSVTGKVLDTDGVWEVKAQFAGDEGYRASDSNTGKYTIQHVVATTFLKLDPISSVSPGDPITVQGILKTESDGIGIDGKTVILAVTGIDNVPDESKIAVTEDGGKFTFTILGNVLREPPVAAPTRPPIADGLAIRGSVPVVGDSVKFQAQFDGDGEYLKSTSNEVSLELEGDVPTDIPRVQVRDVVLEEEANKKVIETKLPTPPPTIPGSSYNSSGPCSFEDYEMPVRGDTLDEVEKRGNELIYKPKDKSEFKTFEYSMIYDCPDPIIPPPPEPRTTEPPQDTPPGAPVIEFPSTGTQKISISQISGTAEPDTTVTVFNGGVALDTTPADSNGDWSLTLGPALGEGTYSFTASAMYAGSNTGDLSSDVNVIVDTTGPTVTANPASTSNPSPVALSSSDPDIDTNAIYYTSDETNPASSSGTQYTSPVNIGELAVQKYIENGKTEGEYTITLKFMGYDTLGNAGPMGTEVYTINVIG